MTNPNPFMTPGGRSLKGMGATWETLSHAKPINAPWDRTSCIKREISDINDFKFELFAERQHNQYLLQNSQARERERSTLLREANDWQDRKLGPLNVYAPGNWTRQTTSYWADFVDPPKDGSFSGGLAATGRALIATPMIALGTPYSLALDALTSVGRGIQYVTGFAPDGAYLSQQAEQRMRNRLHNFDRR